MKKVIILGILLASLIVLGGGITDNKLPEQEIIKNENINLAIYLNETKTNSIPSKEGNVFDEEKSTCTNEAYIVWDYSSWSPIIKNVSNYPVRCNLYFKTGYSESILNGTDPILKDELIPVTISDDGTVRKADLGSKWYSYEEKQWANAVILKKYDIVDLSENHFDGKLMNGAQIVTDTSGNKAISFDGIDDYVDIVDLPETIDWNSGFTIEFEATWKSVNNYSRILDFGSGPQMRNIIVANFESTNTLDVSTWYENAENETYAQNYIDLNQKIQTKIVYTKNGDGYNIKIYKNGVKIKEDNYTTSNLTSNLKRTNNYIGKSNWSADKYFDGLIYNLKISDSNGNLILWYDLNQSSVYQPIYHSNEVIPEERIESYFVWIPKYRYQLWDLGLYDSLTKIDTTKPHEIPIIFGDYNTSDSVNGECTTPMESGASGNCNVGDYMTHPAFLSIPSKGFWVGKYKVSKNGEIEIKPNQKMWYGMILGEAFKSGFEYKRNLDSHVIKNTEWGAINYLVFLKYG